MIDEPDELIQRVARALGAMPAANPRATARILGAVRARRALAPSRFSRVADWMREPALSVASAGFLAAAALVVGFVTRGALKVLDGAASGLTTTAEMPVPAGPAQLQPAGNLRGEARAVAVPLVFEASDARTVSIVGDFNRWDATASPMKRFGPDGPWTATILAKPGRHIYAFLVDGSTLVADPRAPRVRDLDYGGEASVLMVTAP